MTTFNEPTGEAWIRSVNKRLAMLERVPRVTGATVAAVTSTGSPSSLTSASFDADVLMTSGTIPDPSLMAPQVNESQFDEDGNEIDPFMLEEESDEALPLEAATDLQAAPVTPSDPIIESRATGVAVLWDGTGAGGEAIPVNLLLVEVHRSLEGPDFEPDESTYAGSFLDAGVIDFSDQEYEVQWWFRFVLVTNDGRRSTPSNGVEGTAHKITPAEVGFSASEIDFDGVIAAAAGTAQDALDSANGKNSIHHETFAPTAEANTAGDTWFVHATTADDGVEIGSVVQQWTGLGGTAWEQTTLSHMVISSVDLGTATVGKLSANYIGTGVLSSVVTVTGALAAGDPEGARITLTEDGFRMYRATGALAVNFPTDDLIPNTFEGTVIAETLTVTDGIAIRGATNNELSKGSVLHLSSGTTTPTSKPSVAVSYEQFDAGMGEYLFLNRGFHVETDSGTDAHYALDFYGYGAVRAPGGKRYNYPEITMNGSDTSTRSINGFTVLRTPTGLRHVMLVGRAANGDTTRTWHYEVLDPSTMNTSGTVAPLLKTSLATTGPSYVAVMRVGRAYSPIGSTSRDDMFASARLDLLANPNTISLRRFTCTDSSITEEGTALSVNSPLAVDETLSGVSYGASARMLYPGADTLIWLVHGSVNTYAFSSTGVRLPEFDFPTRPGDTVAGSCGALTAGAMTFVRFLGVNSASTVDGAGYSNLVTKYSNNHWFSPTSSQWFLSGTWFDPDVDGGTHETTQSARSALTMKKRASVSVTVPDYPERPFPTTTDDPTAMRIYLSRGATDPGRTYMEHAGTTTSPNRSLTIGTFTFPAGLAVSPPPAVSNFPASAPAHIMSADETSIVLSGDGTTILRGTVIDATSARLDHTGGVFIEGVRVATQMVKKNELTYNVRDFGAVGNGTSNDSTALNAAIAAAIAAGSDLYWPPGTYYAVSNLVNFNDVRNFGEGIVAPFSAGGGAHYIEPGAGQTNTIYVNGSTGNDSNDGLSAARAVQTLSKVDAIIQHLGNKMVEGNWKFQMSGTFSGGQTFARMPKSTNPIVFEGQALVGGLPVTTIDYLAGGSIFGMRFEPGGWVQLKNLKFTDFTVGFNGYGAIIKGGGDMYVLDCQAVNCDTGFAAVDQSVMGLYSSDVATCTTGVRVQYGSTGTIGASGLGTTIDACETGLLVSRNAVAHLDYSTITDCTFSGVTVDMQSRMAMIAGTIHRNAVGIYVQGAAEWTKDDATDWGFGTANANTVAWRHRGAGHENRLHAQDTHVEWRAYASTASVASSAGTNTALIALGSGLTFPAYHFTERTEQKLRAKMHGVLAGSDAKSIQLYKTDTSGTTQVALGGVTGVTQAGEFTLEIEVWPTGAGTQMYAASLYIEGLSVAHARGTSSAAVTADWLFRLYANSGAGTSTVTVTLFELFITG